MADNFHPDYLEAEKDWSKRATFWTEAERKLRADVRADVELTPEERQQKYVEGYEQLMADYTKAHDTTINRAHSQRTGRCENVLYGPGGAKYADHLIALAATPDERLEALYNLAVQGGQHDLARAVAHTANGRGRTVLFREWVAADPDRSAALDYLDRSPNPTRFVDRTVKAHRPPKASPEALEPTRADKQRAAEAKRAASKPIREFFGSGPKRQVGRRML